MRGKTIELLSDHVQSWKEILPFWFLEELIENREKNFQAFFIKKYSEGFEYALYVMNTLNLLNFSLISNVL